MRDPGGVDAVERGGERREDRDRLARVEGAATFEQLGEAAAGEPFEHEDGIPPVGRDVLEAHDVLPGRAGERLDLDLARGITARAHLEHDGAALVEPEQEARPLAVSRGAQDPVARDILHASTVRDSAADAARPGRTGETARTCRRGRSRGARLVPWSTTSSRG